MDARDREGILVIQWWQNVGELLCQARFSASRWSDEEEMMAAGCCQRQRFAPRFVGSVPIKILLLGFWYWQ